MDKKIQTSEPGSSSSLSAQAFEYYQQHSQNRKLPKYFCGTYELANASTTHNNPQQHDIHQTNRENVGAVESRPPLIGEDNPQQIPIIHLDTEHANELVRPPSPTSSITSNRKLEWDNGADIGYHNYQEHKSLYKSHSLPILTSLDLQKNYLRLSPEGTNTDASPTIKTASTSSSNIIGNKLVYVTSSSDSSSSNKNLETSTNSSPTIDKQSSNRSESISDEGQSKDVLNFLKIKVGIPIAESTPFCRLDGRNSDPIIYNTPLTSKLHKINQLNEQPVLKLDINTSVYNVGDSDSASSNLPADTIKLNPIKKSISCDDLIIAPPDDTIRNWSSQLDLTIEQRLKYYMRYRNRKIMKLGISAPISVECLGIKPSIDKDMQTSRNNISIGVQTEQAIEISRVATQSVVYLQHESDEEISNAKVTISSDTDAISNCNSFEFLCGSDFDKKNKSNSNSGSSNCKDKNTNYFDKRNKSNTNSGSSNSSNVKNPLVFDTKIKSINAGSSNRINDKNTIVFDTKIKSINAGSSNSSNDKNPIVFDKKIKSINARSSNRSNDKNTIVFDTKIKSINAGSSNSSNDKNPIVFDKKIIPINTGSSNSSNDINPNVFDKKSKSINAESSNSSNDINPNVFDKKSKSINAESSNSSDDINPNYFDKKTKPGSNINCESSINDNYFKNANLNQTGDKNGSPLPESSILSPDIGKSIRLLQKLINSKKYDDNTKQYYINKIVQKISNGDSCDDSSINSSNSNKIIPEIYANTLKNAENILISKAKSLNSASLSVHTSNDNKENDKRVIIDSSSEQSGDYPKKFVLPTKSNYTDTSNEKSCTNESKSWREDKTLSEKLLEQKVYNFSGGDSLEQDYVLKFAKNERFTQLSWINNEIEHLSKLKKMLEHKESLKRNQCDKKRTKKTTLYMITTDCDATSISPSFVNRNNAEASHVPTKAENRRKKATFSPAKFKERRNLNAKKTQSAQNLKYYKEPKMVQIDLDQINLDDFKHVEQFTSEDNVKIYRFSDDNTKKNLYMKKNDLRKTDCGSSDCPGFTPNLNAIQKSDNKCICKMYENFFPNDEARNIIKKSKDYKEPPIKNPLESDKPPFCISEASSSRKIADKLKYCDNQSCPLVKNISNNDDRTQPTNRLVVEIHNNRQIAPFINIIEDGAQDLEKCVCSKNKLVVADKKQSSSNKNKSSEENSKNRKRISEGFSHSTDTLDNIEHESYHSNESYANESEKAHNLDKTYEKSKSGKNEATKSLPVMLPLVMENKANKAKYVIDIPMNDIANNETRKRSKDANHQSKYVNADNKKTNTDSNKEQREHSDGKSISNKETNTKLRDTRSEKSASSMRSQNTNTDVTKILSSNSVRNQNTNTDATKILSANSLRSQNTNTDVTTKTFSDVGLQTKKNNVGENASKETNTELQSPKSVTSQTTNTDGSANATKIYRDSSTEPNPDKESRDYSDSLVLATELTTVADIHKEPNITTKKPEPQRENPDAQSKGMQTTIIENYGDSGRGEYSTKNKATTINKKDKDINTVEKQPQYTQTNARVNDADTNTKKTVTTQSSTDSVSTRPEDLRETVRNKSSETIIAASRNESDKLGNKTKINSALSMGTSVTASTTSSSSSSSSNESNRVCICCQKRNGCYRYIDCNQYDQMPRPMFCGPCFATSQSTNFHPYYANTQHICSCYQQQTDPIIEIKNTIKELSELEAQEECCQCFCQSKTCGLRRPKQKGVAYMLTFDQTGEVEDEDPGFKRKSLDEVKVKIPFRRKDDDKKKHKHHHHSSKHSKIGKSKSEKRKSNKEPKYTLQECLAMNRPNFIESAEHRRQCMIELCYMREQRCQKYKQLLALTNGIPMQNPSYNDIKNKKNRLFTSSEMKRITAKKYKKLPEVQQKLVESRDNQIKKANRLLADIFNKKLRENVLKGNPSLSASVSVINLI